MIMLKYCGLLCILCAIPAPPPVEALNTSQINLMDRAGVPESGFPPPPV